MTEIEQALHRENMLLAELVKLNGQPLRGKYEWLILVHPGRYVSGLPYLYTGFSERAFVFGSRKMASEFARKLGKKYRLIKLERRN